MTTATWWTRVIKAVNREFQKPDPITARFYRRDKLAFSVVWILLETTWSAILISLTAYIALNVFSAPSPSEWLVDQIAWLYSRICLARGECSLPNLHAGLIVGIELLAFFTVLLWRVVGSIGQVDDTEELHRHLDLVSEQIRLDYNGLAHLEERVNAVEAAIEEADQRVDVVVEYQPSLAGNNGGIDPGA